MVIIITRINKIREKPIRGNRERIAKEAKRRRLKQKRTNINNNNNNNNSDNSNTSDSEQEEYPSRPKRTNFSKSLINNDFVEDFPTN